jgi:hypothetical protein
VSATLAGCAGITRRCRAALIDEQSWRARRTRSLDVTLRTSQDRPVADRGPMRLDSDWRSSRGSRDGAPKGVRLDRRFTLREPFSLSRSGRQLVLHAMARSEIWLKQSQVRGKEG